MKTLGIVAAIVLSQIKIVLSNLPLCRKGNYTKGKWVEFDRQTPSFHCCERSPPTDPINPINHPICHDSSYASYVGIGVGHACVCEHALPNRNSVLSIDMYDWIPDSCYLLQWEDNNFCKLLGSRKLVIIGDSTSFYTHYTLKAMMWSNKQSCQNQIIHIENFWLNVHRGDTGLQRSPDVYKDLVSSDADIVIVSEAAHVHESHHYETQNKNESKTWKAIMDDVYWAFDKYKQEKEKENNQRKFQLVYSTALPGIKNCNLYSAPVPERLSDQDMWNWKSLYEINDYARSNLTIPVIDLTPLDLRPDAKCKVNGDCLHACIPGPLNIFPQILAHMMFTGEIA